MTRRRILAGVAICLFSTLAWAADRKTARLANEYIRADIELVDAVWAHCGLSRADGSDAMKLASDEFEILMFDDSRLTAKDYEVTCFGRKAGNGGSQSLVVQYKAKAAAGKAPRGVTVTYPLGKGPYVHKTVTLAMNKGDRIDRLAVLRFSTPIRASRGGRGEAVFVGNWFVGADYRSTCRTNGRNATN